ncbi:hypothetical protein LEP1GSC192_0342 [Leptospira sp. B5-022]|nr:hypothetical protein LEP1GSC192_0342 [Leptospira sp. B5-022]
MGNLILLITKSILSQQEAFFQIRVGIPTSHFTVNSVASVRN